MAQERKRREGHSPIYFNIAHGAYDFRPGEDKYFTINGYHGCDLCSEYDKHYSLIDPNGRVVTKIQEMSEQYMNYFRDNAYVLCYNCSGKFSLETVKRDYHRYNLDDDATLPVPCEIGLKVVRVVEKEEQMPESDDDLL